MLLRLRSFLSVLLCGVLIWTSSGAAEAAGFLRTPDAIFDPGMFSFQNNQERMRLETEAMSLQMVDSAPLGDRAKFPFITHLIDRARIPLNRAVRPIHPQIPINWVQAAVLALAIAQAFGLLGHSGQVLLGCGIIGSLGENTDQEMLAANEERAYRLAQRGIQSAGYFMKVKVKIPIPESVRVPGIPLELPEVVTTRFDGHKQWFDKRGDRVSSFFEEVAATHQQAMKRAEPPIPGAVQSHSGHTRYATTGADGTETVEQLTAAAQPAFWTPGQLLPQWVAGADGHPKLTYAWLEHLFYFNGDADRMHKMLFRLFGVSMDNDQLRSFLAMIHYVNLEDIPSGDAQTMTALADLFDAQGFWFPALKYAMAIHVRRNVKDPPPPKESLEAWSQVFNRAFHQYRKNIRLPPGAPLEDISQEELDGFLSFMTDLLKDPRNINHFFSAVEDDIAIRRNYIASAEDLRNALGPDLPVLLHAAVNAFAKNSLPYAVMHEIKPRFEGTIAGAFVSTADERHVLFVQGQPASVVIDGAGKNATYASDRRVTQGGPGDRWRLVANSGVGEVWVIEHDGRRINLSVNSGPENRPHSEDELSDRRRDVLDPAQVDPLPKADERFTDDPLIESENRHIPGQLKALNDGIDNGTDQDFLIPAMEFTRVFFRQRIWERIRRNIYLGERDIPPDIDARIRARADDLSRSIFAMRKEGRPFDVNSLSAEVSRAADDFTDLLIDMGFEANTDGLPALFRELERLVLHDTRSLRERARDAFKLLLRFWRQGFLAKAVPAEVSRLEKAPYDLVMISSEKGDYAGTAFAEEMASHFGVREAHYVSNDIITLATQFGDDHEGFLRRLGIDPEHTIVFVTSESAETFDTELGGGEWFARLVKEMFVMTSGKDNRLSDLVGRHRTFHFGKPLTTVETHLAAYAAMNLAFTRLLIFVGENISSRFTGRIGRLFFETSWTSEQWMWVRNSIRKMVDETIPAMMGYNPDHTAIPDRDRENLAPGEELPPHQTLNEQGHYFGEVVLEPARTKIMSVIYVFNAVVFGTSVFALIFKGVAIAFHLHLNGYAAVIEHLLDVVIYCSLVLIPTLTRRALVKAWNWVVRIKTIGIMDFAIAISVENFALYFIERGSGFFPFNTHSAAYDLIALSLANIIFLSALTWSLIFLLHQAIARWSWVRRLHALVNRQLPTASFLAGFGPKDIRFADSEDYIVQFITLMGRKAFAMAFGINTPSIEGAKLTKAPHERAVSANRRTYLVIGRPAGLFKALAVVEDAALMLGKQAKSILSLPYRWMGRMRFSKRLRTPISPHVVMVGAGDVPKEQLKKQKAYHRHVPLPPETILTPDAPEHVALFFGSRIDAYKRLIGYGRILTTMVMDVASHYPSFESGRTHANTGSQTTPCTVPGQALIAQLASMPLKVELIKEDQIDQSEPSPYGVVTRLLTSWTPELEADLKPANREPQPSRLRTEAPGPTTPAVRPASGPQTSVTAGRRPPKFARSLRISISYVVRGIIFLAAVMGLTYLHVPSFQRVVQMAIQRALDWFWHLGPAWISMLGLPLVQLVITHRGHPENKRKELQAGLIRRLAIAA